MATHRISIDIDEDEHKYLKMCCAKLGVTIKQFVIAFLIFIFPFAARVMYKIRGINASNLTNGERSK